MTGVQTCALPIRNVGADGSRAGTLDDRANSVYAQPLPAASPPRGGLQKMVEEERYCADVLSQVSSVQEALRGVGRSLLRNHLKHCASTAIRSADTDRAEAMYDELVDLMYKSAR